MATTPSAPLVDWHTLGEVLGISLALGVGIVVVFTIGIYSLSIVRKPGSAMVVRAVSAIIVGVAWAVIAATVVWGLYYILHK